MTNIIPSQHKPITYDVPSCKRLHRCGKASNCRSWPEQETAEYLFILVHAEVLQRYLGYIKFYIYNICIEIDHQHFSMSMYMI